MLIKRGNIRKLVLSILIALGATACSMDEFEIYYPGNDQNPDTDLPRVPSVEDRHVFIHMALGFNNLTSYLKEDIRELASSNLPGPSWKDDVILVFSHFTASNQNYATQTSPTLTRLYKDRNGNVVKDTLWVMDSKTISASAKTIEDVLKFTKETFPASGYGILISSHGTGWVPENYSNNPEKFDPDSDSNEGILMRQRRVAKPFLDDLSVDGEPPVKSIGVQNTSRTEMMEIDITDLADAIPMKLDYIIFDACFMGGVEVAYEFRDVCEKMVFSQTEILGDGMDYTTILDYLLGGDEPDLEGFCENYYNIYNSKSGSYKSATISLVDCSKMSSLAEVCGRIFTTYRQAISLLEYKTSEVQRYFRSSYEDYHKWFYDLQDIVIQAGAQESELNALQSALDQCVLYKACTERFMNAITMRNHCGLSMYLPYCDRDYLNTFYKGLEWNKATGLVQ